MSQTAARAYANGRRTWTSLSCAPFSAGETDGKWASYIATDLSIMLPRQNLAPIVSDLDAFAPGTAMTGLSVSEEEDRLIAETLTLQQ